MTATTINLVIDAEFQSAMPPLSEDVLRGLEAEILRDGCREPLIAWDGVLVDGHNRYAICNRHAVPFDVREIEFEDREHAMLWIREHQRNRRNLTDDQRAMNAAAILELRSQIAKRERARRGGHAKHKTESCLEDNVVSKQSELEITTSKPRTRAAVAKDQSISERKLRNAAEVKKKAPELAAKVEAGKLSLTAATKQVRKAAKQAAKRAVAVDAPSKTSAYTLITSEIARVNGEIANGSLDWIITDPPYPKKYLSVYDDLGAFAAKYLNPGGSLICMVGQSYLPQIVESLGKHLTYHWMLSYLMPGGQSVQLWDRKVNTFWKPLLWFVNGTYEGDWIGDVCKSSHNDKEHHHWGQSESGMADIIERFTYPGQVVCDPFCGGGTTGVVSVCKGRRFVGVDNDPSAIESTKARLVECSTNA